MGLTQKLSYIEFKPARVLSGNSAKHQQAARRDWKEAPTVSLRGLSSLEQRHRDNIRLQDYNRTSVFFCIMTNVSDQKQESEAVRMETWLQPLQRPVRAHFGQLSSSNQDIPDRVKTSHHISSLISLMLQI